MVALLSTACGDDDPGSVDASAPPSDSAIAIDAAPPLDAELDAVVNHCLPADASGAQVLNLSDNNMAIVPNGTGGDIATGSYELTAVELDLTGVSGTIQGRLEIGASNANTGGAALHLQGSLTAPVTATFDEMGFGLYEANGNGFTLLQVAPCPPPLFASTEYTSSPTEITIWTTIMLAGSNVDIEATFTQP